MSWHAVILAASRGAEDPMAKDYGALHKCMIDIGGKPMLVRVVEALRESGVIGSIVISTEASDVYSAAVSGVEHSPSQNSAPSSALAAIRQRGSYPVLITTGDHALLTPEMVLFVCQPRTDADIGIGLARAETIQAAYPETKRTYFKLGPDRVSGCNLFAVYNADGLKLLERWQDLERYRKQPWKLVFAFGLMPLIRFITGQLTLDAAFAEVSRQICARAVPLLLPFAEAAIDVDKPSDKELAEVILARRR